MRTTIDIPDHLSPVLRSVARDRGISLSQVVGELLTQFLAGKSVVPEPIFGVSPSGFPTLKCGSRITISKDAPASQDG